MKMINYNDRIFHGSKVIELATPFDVEKEEAEAVLAGGSEEFDGIYREGFDPADAIAVTDEAHRLKEIAKREHELAQLRRLKPVEEAAEAEEKGLPEPVVVNKKSQAIPTLNDLRQMDRNQLRTYAEKEGLEINSKWNNQTLSSKLHKYLLKETV